MAACSSKRRAQLRSIPFIHVSASPALFVMSIAAMARVLSDENMALLKVVREQQPDSMDIGRQLDYRRLASADFCERTDSTLLVEIVKGFTAK
jgi:hypothetical protein